MTIIFIHYERKTRDVDSFALFAMVFTSFVPLVREVFVIIIFLKSLESKNDGVLFKRYEK